MGNKDIEINLLLSEAFLAQTGGAVRIPSNSTNISSYDIKP